jgi:hypothetical protein
MPLQTGGSMGQFGKASQEGFWKTTEKEDIREKMRFDW